jgi:maleylpyruvate isomerase
VSGPTGAAKPVDDIAACAASYARLLTTIDGMTEATARRPSQLPGWSVAHVLAHLARNADSHVHRLEGAMRGEVVDQYRGGFEGRAAEIEESARQPIDALLDDVRDRNDAFVRACDAMPADAWSRVSRDVGGTERPAHTLPLRRWQEIEVHHVDLGLRYTHRDWPHAFVARRLPELLAALPSRLPAGTGVPALDGYDDRDLVAWMYDRIEIPALPALTPYG